RRPSPRPSPTAEASHGPSDNQRKTTTSSSIPKSSTSGRQAALRQTPRPTLSSRKSIKLSTTMDLFNLPEEVAIDPALFDQDFVLDFPLPTPYHLPPSPPTTIDSLSPSYSPEPYPAPFPANSPLPSPTSSTSSVEFLGELPSLEFLEEFEFPEDLVREDSTPDVEFLHQVSHSPTFSTSSVEFLQEILPSRPPSTNTSPVEFLGELLPLSPINNPFPDISPPSPTNSTSSVEFIIETM
ncbi:PREDICTED: putative uncharacterized protein DDB_G0290521, partial [Vollenhovia emeryi]|uniref:putative uncharacterized protein DDB_G0290521 n=1 Tax=Vollenhovia emeryi TaxID=411798 RepID=UPI0005F4BE13